MNGVLTTKDLLDEENRKAALLRGIDPSLYMPPADMQDPDPAAAQYNTELPPDQEEAFKAWVASRSQKEGRDVSKDLTDYDLRGAFQSNAKQAANGHLPDTFKKPNHPTFSDQSDWNGAGNKTGGHWSEGPSGTSFQPSEDNVANLGADGLAKYFKTREPGVSLGATLPSRKVQIDDSNPAVSVDDVALPDPSRLGPEEDPPAPAPMAPVKPKSTLETFRDALMSKFAPKPDASPQTGPTAGDRASAALYAGFTRSKVPEMAFNSNSNPKGSSDPYAAFKADLMAQKFGFDKDKEAWDRTQDTTKNELNAEKQKHKESIDAIINGFKERGVITAEKAQELREQYAPKNYEQTVRKNDIAENNADRVQGRFSNTSLQKYGDKIAADLPTVAIFKDLEREAPGLIRGDVKSLIAQAAPDGKNPLNDPNASEDDVLSFLHRLKDLAPKGLGSRMESTKAARIRSAIAQLENMTTHDLFGSALTKVEADKAKRVFHSGLLDSPEAQAAVLDMFRHMTADKLRAREASLRPGIELTPGLWEQYREGGGVTADDPWAQGDTELTPQTSDTPVQTIKKLGNEVKNFVAPKVQKAAHAAQVQVTNGKETLMIDASDLADAIKDGFQRVK